MKHDTDWMLNMLILGPVFGLGVLVVVLILAIVISRR
jgi:hypothetical protein